jgi:hypothetical protein
MRFFYSTQRDKTVEHTILHVQVEEGRICIMSKNFNLNHWVMHPVACVSTNIRRNLRTQQMSVLVLLCTSYTTRWPPIGAETCSVRSAQ